MRKKIVMRNCVLEVKDIESGKTAAKEIIERLKGKKFDIVTSHSQYIHSLAALEDVSLKSDDFEVVGSLIRIHLDPSKNLSFDVKDKTVVIFESERQIRIERRLSSGHKLIRTILIQVCP